jgi:hypothetical protein
VRAGGGCGSGMREGVGRRTRITIFDFMLHQGNCGGTEKRENKEG